MRARCHYYLSVFTNTSPRVKPVLVILVLVHVHYTSLSHRDCAAGIGGKDGDTIYFKDSIDIAKASFEVYICT